MIPRRPRLHACLLAVACALAPAATAADAEDTSELAVAFACEVARRLEVPAVVQDEYAARLRSAIEAAGLGAPSPQHFLLVDRAPRVQAAFVYQLMPGGELRFTGAAPVSTGRPGTFEHFATPLGVFPHSLDNPDFRAEGTPNDKGIRGYGRRGMRVFDFGWVRTPKGWGNHAESEMRLQVHATDPDRLEPLLGEAHSKGCIRALAALVDFLDRHAILDADYEEAAAQGRRMWVLRPDRQPTRWPGRYLVVVDSAAGERPDWSRPTRARLDGRQTARAGAADNGCIESRSAP